MSGIYYILCISCAYCLNVCEQCITYIYIMIGVDFVAARGIGDENWSFSFVHILCVVSFLNGSIMLTILVSFAFHVHPLEHVWF